LSQQIRVLAMRTLDAALGGIAFALSGCQLLAAGRQLRLHVARGCFAARQLDPQLLETLLALEHARVRIAAAIDAQPVAPDPFAGTRDDRLIVCQFAP
jgi:hypothetical protein